MESVFVCTAAGVPGSRSHDLPLAAGFRGRRRAAARSVFDGFRNFEAEMSECFSSVKMLLVACHYSSVANTPMPSAVQVLHACCPAFWVGGVIRASSI